MKHSVSNFFSRLPRRIRPRCRPPSIFRTTGCEAVSCACAMRSFRWYLIFSSGGNRRDLGSSVQRGIRAAGFVQPRPIQERTIPATLEGRDILGLAQTGTGKTAAFALPVLERLLATRGGADPRVLIVAPTRELATQIGEEIRSLARFTRIKVATVFGGVSINAQINGIARPPPDPGGLPRKVAGPGWPQSRRAPRFAWRPWCWTRRTTCSTWAFCPTSAGSGRAPRAAAEPAVLGDHAEGDPAAGQASCCAIPTWSS